MAHARLTLVCSRLTVARRPVQLVESPLAGEATWCLGALSPVPGMSRRRPRGEALASCLLWEIPRKEQSPGLGRGTVGGRRVGQRLCSSAPEPGNPRRLHPATPTAGRNSVAGEEVWEGGQRAPPHHLLAAIWSSRSFPEAGTAQEIPSERAALAPRRRVAGWVVAPGTQCPWHGGQPSHKSPFVLPPRP